MTAKIKLNAASGGGSFSLQAPSSSANNRVFTLPDIADATMATVNGITEYDIWKLTSNLTVSSDSIFITANLARVTFFTEKIGTGVSESSGVFSFPSTGKYEIHAIFQGFHTGGNDDLFKLGMWGTTNDSDYNGIVNCRGGTDNASEGFSTSFVYLIDIPNISTHKIKFGTESAGTNVLQLDGANNNALDGTYFIFKKIGDT